MTMKYSVFPLLFLFINAAFSSEVSYFEQEPNNDPVKANRLNPPVKVLGEMSGADQDMFVWDVKDADADYQWDIELKGRVGQLTKVELMQLQMSEDGKDVLRADTIFSMKSRNGLDTQIKKNLVFAAGKYYFAFSSASRSKVVLGNQSLLDSELLGDLDQTTAAEVKKTLDSETQDFSNYRLTIRKRKKLYPLTINPNNNQQNPTSLYKNSSQGVFNQQKSRWLQFEIKESESDNKWQISGHSSVGNSIALKLYDSDINVMAEVKSSDDGYYQLTDLQFSAGKHRLELISKNPNKVTSLKLQITGQIIAGEEKEPNDSEEYANSFEIGETIKGRVGTDKEYDYFKFKVPEALSGHRFSVEFSNPEQTNFRVCLLKKGIYEFKCELSDSDISFKHISLNSGEYGFIVYKGVANSSYEFAIEDQGIRNTLFEAEPNDSFESAVMMNGKRIVKGEFNGGEYDYYKFNIDKESQLWTVQVNGQNIHSISLYNAKGKDVQSLRFSGDTKRAKLPNLLLMPGEHVISVKGEDSNYLLRVFSTGKPKENFEKEPNDSSNTATKIDFGQKKKGILANIADRDFYYFKLDNEQHFKLTIQPPADGSIKYYLNWNGMSLGSFQSQAGKAMIFQGTYPMGEYSLELKTTKNPSDSAYSVELLRMPALSCQQDCEPNDSIQQAEAVAENFNISGFAGDHGDSDWYRLPMFQSETIVSFKSKTKDERSIRVSDGTGQAFKRDWDYDNKYYSFTLPAKEQAYIKIPELDQAYDFDILVNGIQSNLPQTEIEIKDISIKYSELEDKIKAYSRYGQKSVGQVIITNSGTESKLLSISTKSSHFQVTAQLNEQKIQLQAGESQSLPLTVSFPPDINHKQKIRIELIASEKDRQFSVKHYEFEGSINSEAINPYVFWPLEKELLGGLNVASFAMNASRTAEDIKLNNSAVGRGFDKLFDGLSMSGDGFRYRGGRKTESDYITIDLAGEEAHEIIGVSLNPLSEGSVQYYLKDFELQLSLDGIDFKTVLSNQLLPVGKEQSFVLNQASQAKYARLVLLNSFDNRDKSMISLGEWKVIARANSLVNMTKGFNIADVKHGGNVVWALPETSNKWDINLLTEEKENTYVRSKNNDEWQWVVGFHQQRAALISEIQWISQDFSEKKQFFDRVKISVSTTSPVGPWQEILSSDISNTEVANTFALKKPRWARYVKFNVGAVPSREYRYMPETIKIFEQPVSENYSSILAEWGEYNPFSYYEMTKPQSLKNKYPELNNTTKNTAYDLSELQMISGQVQLEQADKPDWYKFKLDQGKNTINISLTGDPTIKTVIQLQDENGQDVPLIQGESNHQQSNYSAHLAAEKYYYLKVFEPPRSVVFSWDTSGSTNNYQSLIYKALNAYTQGVVNGRDEVNFLPFGGQLLMKEWYGKPYLLKTVLNDYPRTDDSSEAETSLKIATKALENRQGSKAIVIITDAITGKDENLWESFIKVQPQVFTLGIIDNGFGGNPNRQIDLLQAWSQVNSGEFHKVESSAEVDIAFQRVAAKLRQPANYSLSLASSFEKELGPGQLKIKQSTQSTSSAVELILDASGSMLKRLNGKRRISVAKEVLIKAVTEIIPAQTPLALRVFGDKQANSCRTDLAIALKPLNPQSAKSIIEKINAKNLAKTPIADSLAKVASDLKKHKGKKIVVLVTDGEETCDGQPEEVIAKLIEQGVDMRLNIVGFAIDDESLKSQFNQWSTQGGGKYFDSNNQESLKNSISKALKTPFSVFSQSGQLIQEGTVNGDSLELLPGYYTIKIYGNTIKTIEKFEVKGEVEQLIDLDKL